MPAARSVRPFAVCAALAAVIAGCGQPVRKDRSVNFAADGKSAGFDHADGVFVAGPDGKPTKIHTPGPEVIATSPPLWSPAGKRAIFTTARTADGQTRRQLALPGHADPAGGAFFQQPAVYTCWLYTPPAGNDPESDPVALFEAHCDHVGYVAGNLAVCWDAKGERVYFVEHFQGGHGLFAFDPASKRKEQICPHAADAIVFDVVPDGKHIACVLGSVKCGGSDDGIWVGKPGGAEWWHVPESRQLAAGELPSLLEALRATRPAWTGDGSRFAFVSHVPGPKPEDPGRYRLRVADFAERSVTTVAEGAEPYRDLHWSPDGAALGVVRGGDGAGSLHFVRGGNFGPAVNGRPVRRFAGWNAAGDMFAYVVPDKLQFADGETWAMLLLPDPLARDAVMIDTGVGGAAREVFAGMRVTFPQWSPTDDKLSMWFTFAPTQQSLATRLLGIGMRPGDPAALFEPKTGHISWMTVNAHEKAQVGHYHLLKRDFATAWKWYDDADRDRPKGGSANVLQLLTSPADRTDVDLFEYYCLARLGRADEAKERLERFRLLYEMPAVPVKTTEEAVARSLVESHKSVVPLFRDLYAAEVFLSLDAPAEGEAYLRSSLRSAGAAAPRFGSAVALSQYLLAQRKGVDYARLATDEIMPALLDGALDASAGSLTQPLVDTAAVCALAPMFSADFLKTLPDEFVRGLPLAWEPLRAKARTDRQRWFVDSVLRGLYDLLGKDARCDAAGVRLRDNPATRELGATLESIETGVKAMRADRRP